MNYLDIKTDNMDNGDGLRVVLWLSGCNHGCKGCQNESTWSPKSGKLFNLKASDIISTELSKDYISGITLTGGDPLHPSNRQDIFKLIDYITIMFPSKTIWLYTGYTWEDIIEENILSDRLASIDVIVDGKYMDDYRDTSLMWRGSPNQRVIDVNKTINTGIIHSHIRFESQLKNTIDNDIIKKLLFDVVYPIPSYM